MKMKQFVYIAGISIFTVLASPTYSEIHKVDVTVDGLVCPFCAYGLEKKLKGLDRTKKIEINLEKGIAAVTFNDSSSVTVENIEHAVNNAGFTPREYKLQVTGYFLQDQSGFQVSGTKELYVVDPNNQFEEIKKDEAYFTKTYTIVGTVRRTKENYVISIEQVNPLTKENEN